MTEKEMRLRAVKAHNLPQFYFYQVPQLLFYGKYRELSGNARLLYGMLWDKLRLAPDKGWIDKKGNLFVRLARKTAGFKLNISKPTVQNCYEQLEAVDLIYRIRNGKTLVDDVYPLPPDPSEASTAAYEQLKIIEAEEEAAFAQNPIDFDDDN